MKIRASQKWLDRCNEAAAAAPRALELLQNKHNGCTAALSISELKSIIIFKTALKIPTEVMKRNKAGLIDMVDKIMHAAAPPSPHATGATQGQEAESSEDLSDSDSCYACADPALCGDIFNGECYAALE